MKKVRRSAFSRCTEGRANPGSTQPKALALLALFFSLTGTSWPGTPQGGQDTPVQLKRLSLEQLGSVEVTTASKEPVTVGRTPAAIYVLTQEDIRLSGASSIPEVLRLVPGVEVARIDSDKWSIGVRGFGSRLSRAVLVLIDGRSVYTQLFAGVYWEIQDTLLEDIDRIEVIRGPGGTIWGANAVNAVINIITKSAKDTNGTLASIGGGNVDQGTGAIRYGGRRGQNFDYRIYGKGFSRGPEFHSDHDQFDVWEMGQAGFRMDWNARTRNSFTLQGDLYNAEEGERTTIGSYSAPFAATVDQPGEVTGGNLVVEWHRELSRWGDIQVQTYYDRTNRREASFGESRDTFDVDLIHHLTLPGHQVFLWGLGARLSSGNAEQVIPTILFIPGHRTDKLYSAFLQDEIPLVGEQLSFTLGTKILHNIYTGYEIQPTVRLLWNPKSQQTLWAGVTRAVRIPSRVDDEDELTGLLSTTPPTFIRLIGDGNFTSEHLLSYEAGYRGLAGHSLHLDITAFYNNYNRLFSLQPGTPFSEGSPGAAHLVVPYFIRNGLLGTTYGVEIAPEWRPTLWWRLQGSYSFLHMDIGNRPGSVTSSAPASAEGSSPQHQIVAQSFLDLPWKLEFGQTFRYVSALPAQGVKSYSTTDVRIGWMPAKSFEFSVSAQNLLQPEHVEFSGDPGPLVGIRRSVYAKIIWRK
jgi:iron complex outermembrane receptor protein